MKCDKCGGNIPSGDERNHHDRTLCEDCYMIVLSPMKTCDPWAVHSAKSCEKFAGDAKQLTQVQTEILRILGADGPMEPETLLARLDGGMQLAELQREFATLRHMEKARGEKQDQKVVWRLWT
jgi:hypothetical protein